MSRVNAILAAIRAGRHARGVFLPFPSPATVEVLGRLALDFVYFDGEHGPFSIADIAEGCRAADAAGLTPIARVPDPSPATIGRFLDAGVMGLLVPHVETAEQAAAVVRAARFAPDGERSYGAGRPEYGFVEGPLKEHLAAWNREIAVSVMIESAAGVEQAEAIAAVRGIDFLSIGLFDLAQSLGFPGEADRAEVREAVARVAAAANRAGCPMRDQVMRFAWLRDVLAAGVAALLPGRQGQPA
jgi:2-keto-3-deoxy-L-rhamnonate aldolase RhmA